MVLADIGTGYFLRMLMSDFVLLFVVRNSPQFKKIDLIRHNHPFER